jgi:hypothetical protein
MLDSLREMYAPEETPPFSQASECRSENESLKTDQATCHIYLKENVFVRVRKVVNPSAQTGQALRHGHANTSLRRA